MPKPSAVRIDLFDEIHGFVVGVPADAIHKADPIDHTDGGFRAKLDDGAGFAAE